MKKRYSKGTDSVPAMLTPKEAVLVPNAAELLGRRNIAALNAHGNMLAKRGVDLASLPSDPTPGPSTENMLGYQMGTANVRRDDRADLLRDTENTFYGGGGAPAPSPTPTPAPRRAYQYGTSSVDDFDVFKKNNLASRINRPGIINIQDDPTKSNYNPVGTSQYIGKGGTLLGPQYNQQTGSVNPLPSGAVGLQGFSQPPTNPTFATALTHTQMATDIAKRNLTATGSQLGSPQQSQFPFASRYQDTRGQGGVFRATSPEGSQWSINLPVNENDVMAASQYTGGAGGYGMKKATTTGAYFSPQNQQMLGQQQENRISRIQSDTLRDQGIDINQPMQNVNLNTLANIQANKDAQNPQGYGSAYGY